MLDNGTVLLLANINVNGLPQNAITDHLGVFECLLSETTKRYDSYTDCNCSAEDELETLKISKVIGIMLINYLGYNKLPTDKVELIASFVYKLAQYYLTMTLLVDQWFEGALKEPDITYLLYRNKLPADCFPMYELAKDFLFMNQNLYSISKDSLLHLVLTTGFSKPLENWLLMSDFPGLVITGLLSSFNQLCYDEILFSTYKNDFDAILANNENFKEYNQYLTFILNSISYSTHDSVKFVFLKCFESRFINPVINYYTLNETYHVNIAFLLSHTIIQLLNAPESGNNYSLQLIVEDFIEKYLGNKGKGRMSLLDIFKKSLLQPIDNTILIISSLNLFKAFCNARSVNLLLEIFGNEQHFVSNSIKIIHNDSNIYPIIEKARVILENEQIYKEMLFMRLDESYKLLQKNAWMDISSVSSSKTWLQFSSSKDIPMLTLSRLVSFFNNEYDVNRSLIALIQNLIVAHGGKLFNFVLSDTDSSISTLFGIVLTYLWETYEVYTEKLNSGSKLFEIIKPKQSIFEIFNDCDVSIENSIVEFWSHTTDCPVLSFEKLALNVELFKEFIIDLYSLHKARNIFNLVLVE